MAEIKINIIIFFHETIIGSLNVFYLSTQAVVEPSNKASEQSLKTKEMKCRKWISAYKNSFLWERETTTRSELLNARSKTFPGMGCDIFSFYYLFPTLPASLSRINICNKVSRPSYSAGLQTFAFLLAGINYNFAPNAAQVCGSRPGRCPDHLMVLLWCIRM